MNEHSKNKQPCWHRHLHGVADSDDVEALKKALKEMFPKTGLVARPVQVEAWDRHAKWLRYCHQSVFKRRISILGQRHDKKTGKKRQCRDTDKQPLKSSQKLELLLHLDAIGLGGRLLLRGVQFRNLRGSGPTLVEIAARTRSSKNATVKPPKATKRKKETSSDSDW
jgi:hypothetical protein